MDTCQELNSLMRPRKVCLCNGVSEKDIALVYQNGAKTLRAIIDKTKASTGCGTCLDELVRVVNHLIESEKLATHPKLFK